MQLTSFFVFSKYFFAKIYLNQQCIVIKVTNQKLIKEELKKRIFPVLLPEYLQKVFQNRNVGNKYFLAQSTTSDIPQKPWFYKVYQIFYEFRQWLCAYL
jgi:hypothetical protein